MPGMKNNGDFGQHTNNNTEAGETESSEQQAMLQQMRSMLNNNVINLPGASKPKGSKIQEETPLNTQQDEYEEY